MEPTQKKTRAHQVYKLADGTRVPGTTTITGLLNKPALVRWANRLGLEGVDSAKYVDSKASAGTLAHSLIEAHLTGESYNTYEYSRADIDAAANSVAKWKEWESGHNLRVRGIEMQLVSEQYRYGGTCDVLCELDGKLTLIDIKTSGSGIWPEMRIQVAAYEQLLVEAGYPVEQRMIVRVGRDESEGFEVAELPTSESKERLRLFLALLEVYQIRRGLGDK